jgi:tetratricopeptide (TPR) repeat protein
LKALYRLGQLDEMHRLASRFAQETNPAPQAEIMAQASIVDALLSLGEQGEAQRSLDAALAQWPTNLVLQDLAAQLDLAAHRNADAVQHARQSVGATPNDTEYQERLIRALTAAGQTEQALQQFSDVIDMLKAPPVSFFETAAAVAEAKQDWTEAAHIYDRGLALYPRDTNLIGNKAWVFDKQGMKEDAFESIKKSANLRAASSWTTARFREYASAALSADAARLEIEGLRQRQSWE